MVRHLQLAVIVTSSTYHFTIKIVGQSPETACIPKVTLEGALPRSAIAVTGLSPIPHKHNSASNLPTMVLPRAKTMPSSVYLLMPTQTESTLQGGCELMRIGLHCRLHSRVVHWVENTDVGTASWYECHFDHQVSVDLSNLRDSRFCRKTCTIR